MSREKFSWPWIDAACEPAIAALAPSTLPARLAASTPRISEAMPIIVCFLLLAKLRAMWRCVMCDISCASTEPSSSREAVIAIRPRWMPKYPPGSAKALTLRSRTRKGSHAKRWSVSAPMLPMARELATSGCHSDCRYSSSTGSSR
jgi:hypothetical protein